MIALKALLKVIDNTGAITAECIQVLRAGKFASVGDEIVVVVHKAKSNIGSSNVTKVKRGELYRAIVVRTRYPVKRPDGSWLRFSDNACVLVDKNREPLGTRILGVIARETRDKKLLKLVSIAPKLV
ncbi:mitochondrial 54S ribosomal protein YmL38/YmL34 [Schizosaccharomyces japonicus yFS275]|uniref:Large ribosomal subunit protein uL14m n=1 Tax=Schizosaccharomyces japonicus (strain yFS275 / FY16936) TaxID=402676 RepID=B6JVA8_SCHJY|nr:mitochondrial 54S ribosomal protein YmL38/YmL34 [Schizosaccharomyces japonicus yFS275]EEB05309.1 ribosomal protein subunit L38 [Schizosaccharomyces japonicus yFS275]